MGEKAYFIAIPPPPVYRQRGHALAVITTGTPASSTLADYELMPKMAIVTR